MQTTEHDEKGSVEEEKLLSPMTLASPPAREEAFSSASESAPPGAKENIATSRVQYNLQKIVKLQAVFRGILMRRAADINMAVKVAKSKYF